MVALVEYFKNAVESKCCSLYANMYPSALSGAPAKWTFDNVKVGTDFQSSVYLYVFNICSLILCLHFFF